jgi:hypothetical protein
MLQEALAISTAETEQEPRKQLPGEGKGVHGAGRYRL